MSVAEGVASQLRASLAAITERRHALRRRLAGLGRDALVGTLLLGLAVAVSNGGIAGLVLGWTAAFAFAVSLPVLAMKVASAVYGRIGG